MTVPECSLVLCIRFWVVVSELVFYECFPDILIIFDILQPFHNRLYSLPWVCVDTDKFTIASFIEVMCSLWLFNPIVNLYRISNGVFGFAFYWNSH